MIANIIASAPFLLMKCSVLTIALLAVGWMIIKYGFGKEGMDYMDEYIVDEGPCNIYRWILNDEPENSNQTTNKTAHKKYS